MFTRFLLACTAVALLATLLIPPGEAAARPRKTYRNYSYRGSVFSQPQWPKSMRRRGLKQLGPVPAMGGVRSLPGWGGER